MNGSGGGGASCGPSTSAQAQPGGATTTTTPACTPALPRLVDLFPVLAWVFAVVPLLVMLDVATPATGTCG